jgi:glycosyltransferase involved in cell wall biosynthesis
MPSKTSLCFIAWNEKQGCEFDLPQFDFTDFDEVFAIDGGSSDGTVEVLQKYGIVVHNQTHRSLNAAYWQAVQTATCENIIVFFPKGTLDPSITKQMKLLLLQGHDLVVASRLVEGARNEEDERLFRPRKWGVKALALIAAICWRRQGPLIWDVLHGVKGFKKQAFLEMNPAPTGLSIDLEMTVRAYRLRLRACEFPVVEVSRPWGDSRFKILPTGIKLARYLYREFRQPKPLRRSPQSTAPAEVERAVTSGE